jgi:hypothetical protein
VHRDRIAANFANAGRGSVILKRVNCFSLYGRSLHRRRRRDTAEHHAEKVSAIHE